jgi:ADP-ribose pyrophosphatase YjhB (NUDIX family)
MATRPSKIRAATVKEVSVLAWVQDRRGNVLVVQQTAGKKLWSLPGGKVLRLESLRRALHREVREEIGLGVVSEEIVEIFDRPLKGALAVLFQATLREGRIKLQDDEIKNAAFVRKMPVPGTPSLRYFWAKKFPQKSARRQRAKPKPKSKSKSKSKKSKS